MQTGKYNGRPTYMSRAYRNREIPNRCDKHTLKWINTQLENMNPNDWFIIPKDQTKLIIRQSLYSKLANLNRQIGANFKLHAPKNSDWYVWYCPDHLARYNRSGKLIDENAPHTPPKPKRSSGSTFATTQQVCQHLNMTETSFNALPFDKQMQLRIQAGIALRDERVKREKLTKNFAPPTS